MSAPFLIVSGCEGDTRRYRAWHAAESLTMAGHRVTVRTVQSDPPSPAELSGGVTLLLHRVAWHADAARWIAAVRADGGRVLYDTDDRVFDDAFGARAAALGTQAPPTEHRRVLDLCDGCVTATAPLADAVAALGRPAAVVRNAIDLELWRLSDAAWRGRRRTWNAGHGAGRDDDRVAGRSTGRGVGHGDVGGTGRDDDRGTGRGAGYGDDGDTDRGDDRDEPHGLVIGYASGTATHDADFRACAPAVMAALDALPDARLRIIGPLVLDGAWDRFGPRIQRVPFLEWRRLPEAIAAFDINVAPLALDDPFCWAKSELKWFEAAAVGVPTIASATPAFRAAITDGVNGFVVADDEGWRAALTALLDDAPRRRSVGAAAREAVRDGYLTDRRAAEWSAALESLRPGGAGDSRASTAAAAGASRIDVGPAARPSPQERSADERSVAPSSPPLLLTDDPTIERYAMGAEAVLAERAVADAPSIGAVGPWLAARAAVIRRAANDAGGAGGADMVAELPYPVDHRVFASPAGYEDDGEGTANRPPLLFDWALGRDSSRALALQALHAAADRVPRLAVRLFSSAVDAPPPDAAVIDRPGWRQLGPLDAAARAALYGAGGVLVVPCFGTVPLAVLEAMAAGVAIAAVDVPSVRWLLRDGATAALAVPDGDALGVAAARLLSDRARRERIAAAGREAVALHSFGRHAAATTALARGEAAPPPPEAWRLDQFQPFGADLSPAWPDGGSIGLSFIARHDGLCRIDLRVGVALGDGSARATDGDRHDEAEATERSVGRAPAPAPAPAADRPRWRPLDRAEREALVLQVRPGLPAPGIEPARVAAAGGGAGGWSGGASGGASNGGSEDDASVAAGRHDPIDTAGDDWVRFTFAPLENAAGRWWTARLSLRDSLRDDRPDPSVIRIVGVAADAFADGCTMLDDAVATGWSPAFRLWAAAPPATADVLPEPAAQALLDALALTAVEAAEMERREAIVAALWPVRAARWLVRSGAPLPPIDRRPWPPEAPAHVKALGTLRHYGPLAVARELRAMARWRRLDPAAQAAARDQNTA